MCVTILKKMLTKEKPKVRVRVEEPDLTDCPVWAESCPLREGLKCWHHKNASDWCSKPECPIGKEE